MRPKRATITTGDHQNGTIEKTKQATRDAVLTAQFGERTVQIPRRLIETREDGTCFVPLRLDQLERVEPGSVPSSDVSIPVLEERAVVEKRQVVKGKTRIRKKVIQEDQKLDETLYSDEVDIEHIPINQVIDSPVPIRQQDETTIIPIMEEILVVEKRLVLKEEVRITRRKKETQHTQKVTLRREKVEVDHIDQPANSSEKTDAG